MLSTTRVMELLSDNIRNWKTLAVIPENAKISFSRKKVDEYSRNQIRYCLTIDYDYIPNDNKREIIETCMQDAFGDSFIISVKRLPSLSDSWDCIFYPMEIVMITKAQ